MARVVLVRHGESEWNVQRRLQGQGGSGLSARGEAQAAAVAEYLRRAYPSVALGVRSDLHRAEQTAAMWTAVSGMQTRVDVRWREIDVGTWSGLTWDEVAEVDGDTLAAWRAGTDVRRGGGETFAELRARTWDALLDVGDVDGTVVVFTHGGCVRLTVAEALGMPLMAERALAPVDNCSVTELAVRDRGAVLIAYNRADHLDGLQP